MEVAVCIELLGENMQACSFYVEAFSPCPARSRGLRVSSDSKSLTFEGSVGQTGFQTLLEEKKRFTV